MPRPRKHAARTQPTSTPTTTPPMAVAAPTVELRGNELHLTLDARHYRVRGIEKNLSPQQLRVNIMADRDGLVHLDTLDLCKAKSRLAFVKATAAELYVEESLIKKDLGMLLLNLEQVQQERIEAALRTEAAPVELTETQRTTALDYLRTADLTARILADYTQCGLVGEETNKLVCYLACVSRLLPKPLALLVQSSSAAGKSSLMDATLALMPDEAFVRYSAMTGQSLYYMGKRSLKHKILAVAEEEGVAQASYAFKLLQSDGRLTMAAAGRNQGTGLQQTERYEVEGPVMMFLTTTAEAPDEELQNRCLVLQVNESPEQTAAIQARQRLDYADQGRIDPATRRAILDVHHSVQRLLQPLPVIIPAVETLQFRADQIRMRRDHAKYLALIAASALLHQYQRQRQTREVSGTIVESIVADIADIRLANALASAVMGQSLTELLPQTRQLLVLMDDHVNTRARGEGKPRTLVRFTQRELREALGWGDFQLRRHLQRLMDLEFVLAYRTGARNQREYQLLYDGQGRVGEPFLLGLVEPRTPKSPPSLTPPDVLIDHLAG